MGEHVVGNGRRRRLVALGLIVAAGAALSFLGADRAGAAGISALNISPQIASDDERYVAFQRRNGVPTVLDTQTGDLSPLKGATWCQPRDIGARRVLLICPGQDARPKRGDTGFRARTGSVLGGRTRPLAKSRKIHDAYAIGRYWVSVSGEVTRPGQAPSIRFLNWRKGFMKNVFPGGYDLDSRKLKRREVADFTPDPKGYPNPYVDPLVICRGKDVLVTDWKGELRLWWSEDESVRLGKGGFLEEGCKWHGSFRIGSSSVTWSRGRAVHAYDYRTGVGFKRRYPKKGALIAPLASGFVVAEKIKKTGRYRTAFRVRAFGY